jgi:hypothetical protein
MSGQSGGTKHSHICIDAMSAILTEHPDIVGSFPLADALSAGARWNA